MDALGVVAKRGKLGINDVQPREVKNPMFVLPWLTATHACAGESAVRIKRASSSSRPA